MKALANGLQRASLLCIASSGAVFFAGTASAQDTETSGSPVEEIVVTGTRIRSADLTSASPLQVVSGQLIEDQGVINIQDALQSNPAFGRPGESRFTSNGDITTAGTATVNLRNLGANRTLVLVDSKRMIGGVPGTTQVDLTMVPTDFIERVEVLTGGASAVYGSDAVAGVVNLIYKKNFEGLVANVQAGISERGDAEEQKYSITAGHNFADDRGNFMLNATYTDQGPLRGAKRDFSDDNWFSQGVLDADPETLFVRTLNRSTVHPRGTVSVDGTDYTFDDNGNVVPWDINDQSQRFHQAEFDGTRNIASPVERMAFATRATYEVSDRLTGVFESNYGRVSSESRFEPHPYVSNSDVIGIAQPHNVENVLVNPADGTSQLVRNPFIHDFIYNNATDSNNDGLRDVAYSKRMVEFGSRTTDIDRQLFRIVLGAEGALGNNWAYDVHYSYGRTDLSARMGGLFNVPNLRAAMNVGEDAFDFDGDGDTTEAVCIDPVARARGCVPINFYGLNNISEEAKEYVKGTGFQDSVQEMNVVSANITGTLFELPAGPLQYAGGLEYRDESSKHLFDPLSNTHQNLFTQQTDTVGSLSIKEAYSEINVPLLADMPGLRSLSLRGAARVSDYSNLGAFWAYNGGLEWTPIESLRFRAVYARAVRAPNIGELFAAPEVGVTAITDPCQGITESDTSQLAQNCKADPGIVANMNANGGVVSLIQSDFQGVITLNANNPDIAEETATTHTFGAVFIPEALPGSSFTIDYYDIELEDAINRVTSATVLRKCYEESLEDFCDFVTRRAGPETPYSAGSVSQVIRGLVNSGGSFAEGIDITANYSRDVGDGTVSLSGSYTRLLDQGIIPLTGDPVNTFKGEIGYPENKAFVAVNYDRGPLGIALTGEYIGASLIDDEFLTDLFGDDIDVESGSFEVDGELYADLQLKYRLRDAYELYFGVNNLFDTDPPPLWGGIPSGGVSGLYDTIGRNFYLGLRAELF